MIVDRSVGRRVPLTPEQLAMAGWLRGNHGAYDTLSGFITARMDARRQSPVSTEPYAALIDKARDNECLHILRDLETVVNSPLPSLHEGDEEEF